MNHQQQLQAQPPPSAPQWVRGADGTWVQTTLPTTIAQQIQPSALPPLGPGAQWVRGVNGEWVQARALPRLGPGPPPLASPPGPSATGGRSAPPWAMVGPPNALVGPNARPISNIDTSVIMAKIETEWAVNSPSGGGSGGGSGGDGGNDAGSGGGADAAGNAGSWLCPVHPTSSERENIIELWKVGGMDPELIVDIERVEVSYLAENFSVYFRLFEVRSCTKLVVWII